MTIAHAWQTAKQCPGVVQTMGYADVVPVAQLIASFNTVTAGTT